MSKITPIRQSQWIRGLGLFAALVVCSVIAGLAQRVCWIAYLGRSGYGLRDVVVPLSAWISYHTSPIGLALDVLIFGPWLILAGWLWLGRARAKHMPNPQGGANGRQPFGSDTNRTPAAAASRRSP
jgi:hypothetical protein